MNRLRRTPGSPLFAVAALLLACLALPLVLRDEFLIHSLIMVLYFAYLASAWNLMCGYVGQVSFGHSVFSGVGGYCSVLLLTGIGLSPWIGMLLGGLAAASLALAIGSCTMRLRGPYFALTSIAFAEIIRIWLENTDIVFGIHLKGAEGLSVPLLGTSWAMFQFESKQPYYYIIVGMLVLVMTITWLMERSRLGVCLKAIRGDRDAAESLGIDPTRYTLTALALSAFMTALGGSFYAQFIRFINPERNMGTELSIDMALMSIIGGQGTVFGPLVGALFLAPLAEITRSYLGGQFAGLHLVLYGLVLIMAVLYLPKGLLHPLQQWGRRLLARRAPAPHSPQAVVGSAARPMPRDQRSAK
ncbi:branched-chain amino acid ABC transporter permease [Verminephrobacter eiseniae]|uniref:Inner-membrane translocator n=1 Tax=Verminephrobacter eiseniae (strain EF01-2) TaxID=391735 RepID=A1WGB9_VEREI|nr:branched-chain amino acid ABC transporter permease [Verminephrobacter eiseniae]ABM56676.1 inner-membrane translocator [Verminephrobacter eiseniae EF01-2]